MAEFKPRLFRRLFRVRYSIMGIIRGIFSHNSIEAGIGAADIVQNNFRAVGQHCLTLADNGQQLSANNYRLSARPRILDISKNGYGRIPYCHFNGPEYWPWYISPNTVCAR